MGGITAVVDLSGRRLRDRAGLSLGEAEAHRGTPFVHEAAGCSLSARRWPEEEEPIAAGAGVAVVVHGYFFGPEQPTSAQRLLDRYLDRGERGFPELDGEFAFVLWDGHSKTLFLGRDSFGTRPLFVARVDDRVVVATEIRQIQRAGLVPHQLEYDQLWPLLDSGASHGPPWATIFRGIDRIPPGQVRRLSCGKDDRWDLWVPPREIDKTLTSQVVPHLILEVMRRAVGRRRFRRPAFLMSGGLDSPFVAAATMTDTTLAAQFGPEPTAFTHVTPGDPVDEEGRARQVAHHLGLRHITFDLGEVDLGAAFGALVRDCDHPLSLPGIGLLACLDRSNREGFETLVGGIGGDSFWHFRQSEVSPWDLNPARGFVHLLGRLRSELGRGWLPAARELRSLALDLYRPPRGHSTRTWDRRKTCLEEFAHGPYEAREQLAARFRMEFSEPFLDREMAELAFRTPPKLLQRRGDRKRLLAAAARIILPTSFVDTWQAVHYSGYLSGLIAAQADRLPCYPGHLLAKSPDRSLDFIAGNGPDAFWREQARFLRCSALAFWLKKTHTGHTMEVSIW